MFGLFARSATKTQSDIKETAAGKKALQKPAARRDSVPASTHQPSTIFVACIAIVLSVAVHHAGRHLMNFGLNNAIDAVTGGPVLAKALSNVLFSDDMDFQNALDLDKMLNDVELIQATMPVWAQQRSRVYYNGSADVKIPTADMRAYMNTVPAEDLLMTEEIAQWLLDTDYSQQNEYLERLPDIASLSERYGPYIGSEVPDKRLYAKWAPEHKTYGVYTETAIDNEEFVGVLAGELVPREVDPNLHYSVDYLYPVIDSDGKPREMIIYPERYGNLIRHVRLADNPEQKNVRFTWIIKEDIAYMIVISKRNIVPGERLMV